MYTCVTTVPISTHQFPAGNHRPTGLRWNTVYLNIWYQQQSLCHSVTTVTKSGYGCTWYTTLSTSDNTFYFYGICLNRNRKLNLANAHYRNTVKRSFWPSDSNDKFYRLIFKTANCIFWFYKFHENFDESSLMPNEKVFNLPLLFESNCQWPSPNPSNRTNRQITVYFKEYAYMRTLQLEGNHCPVSG